MASPAPSPVFERLVNVWRSLALRSDADDIIQELLGRYALEKVYARPGDAEAHLHLITGLLVKLNAIFYLQRLSLPAENLNPGRYLGLLASWEVTVRMVDFVLQVLLETRHSLVEGQLLRDKHLPEFLLSTLRFLSLHPRPPPGQRGKDRRDRLAHVHRSLDQLLSGSPGPRSFLLETSREVAGRLYSDPAAIGLPMGLKYGLPNLVSELYPLAECLQPHYISELALPGEASVSWLAQFLALRDVSFFVIGAAIQHEAHRETRNARLLASCARSRDAVLHALENLRVPSHMSRAEMATGFSDIFRRAVAETPDPARWDLSGAAQVDEVELDALDAFCTRLSERQVVQRVSDRELMHSISQILNGIMVQDGLASQARSVWPALFAVNCPECHLAGASQLRCADIKIAPGGGNDGETMLSSPSRCPQCGEAINMVREVTVVREAWNLLRPLDTDAETINVERHLPTQFQLSHPRPDVPGFFGHGNPSPPENNMHEERLLFAPPATPSEQQLRGHQGSQPGMLSPPSPDAARQSPSTPPRSIGGSTANLASIQPAFEHEPADVVVPPQPGPEPTRSLPPPPTPEQPPPTANTVRRPSSPRRTVPILESPTLGTAPPWQSLNMASSPEKGKAPNSGWKMKLPGRRKTSVSASAADSSSLSELGSESQRLDEINLSGLFSGHKSSSKNRPTRGICTSLSQHINSTLALFWSQSVIYVCDVSSPSPSMLKRAISTESNCIIATVGLQYLAYIVGTRDQKLTLRIVDLLQPSATAIEYRIPSSQWCRSIAIDQQENYVAVGFVSSVVRFFSTTDNTKSPREERLHHGHKDCKACPPVDTLSFSHDGLFLLAGTRNARTGLIQVYRWKWPFTTCAELRRCQYAVRLHESEDNGISSVIYRSVPDPEGALVCITTWTQSGTPVLIQPEDGHRSEIKGDVTERHSRLGNRIQAAAFSPSGGELVMVNDKGHVYQISNMNSSTMEVKRIASSKELTARSDAFSLAFMAVPDEECVVLAWADASKMIGWIKRIPGSYQNTVPPPATAAGYVTSPLTPESSNDLPSAIATEVKPVELELTMSPVELPAIPAQGGMGRSFNQYARKPVAPEPFDGKW